VKAALAESALSPPAWFALAAFAVIGVDLIAAVASTKLLRRPILDTQSWSANGQERTRAIRSFFPGKSPSFRIREVQLDWFSLLAVW
jgi:hypothetical protein